MKQILLSNKSQSPGIVHGTLRIFQPLTVTAKGSFAQLASIYFATWIANSLGSGALPLISVLDALAGMQYMFRMNE